MLIICLNCSPKLSNYKRMHYNLSQIEEIANGDEQFKREMISIFVDQIPGFIENMNTFLETENWQSLAREAHTTKSSVLVFGMQETGTTFKKIQAFAENEQKSEIEEILPVATKDLEVVLEELLEYLREAKN